MVNITRLNNGNVEETKYVSEEIVRPVEAEKGFGWYNIVEPEVNLEAWEKISDVSYGYDEIEDVVTRVSNKVDVPLQDFKDSKKQELKTIHEQKMKEGFTSSTNIKLDCEPHNINDFANAKQLLDISGAADITIRDYDNAVHTLAATDFTVLVLELANYYQTLLATKWGYQDSTDSKTTYEDVNGVEWI